MGSRDCTPPPPPNTPITESRALAAELRELAALEHEIRKAENTYDFVMMARGLKRRLKVVK